MYAQVEKPKENESRAVANSVAQKKSNGKQGFGFVDNRPVKPKRYKDVDCDISELNSTEIIQRKIVTDLTGYKNAYEDFRNAVKEFPSGFQNKILKEVNCSNEEVTIEPKHYIEGVESGYEPSRKRITWITDKSGLAHEQSDQLQKNYKGGNRVMGKATNTTVYGNISPSVALYHEIGHAHQDIVIGVSFDRYEGVMIHIIELHNMLKTESQMAQEKGQPVRSRYEDFNFPADKSDFRKGGYKEGRFKHKENDEGVEEVNDRVKTDQSAQITTLIKESLEALKSIQPTEGEIKDMHNIMILLKDINESWSSYRGIDFLIIKNLLGNIKNLLLNI